jgi:hypothetical protein
MKETVKVIASLGAIALAWYLLPAFWSFDSEERAAESARDQRVAQCQTEIKATLRNPRSVQWIEPWNWPVENGVVHATFRAENGFGGMNVETTTCGG